MIWYSILGMFILAGAAGYLGIWVYSGFTLPGRMRITRHSIHLDRLPSVIEGLTIVQLTDIHQGLWIRSRHVRRIVELVNEMNPDIIVLTGDYAVRPKSNIERAGRALTGLVARYGVYAVLGNHDYWADGPRVIRALREAGIDVLVNENRRIDIGNEHIWLAGFDDKWAGHPNYEGGLSGIPEGDLCIGMAHNPYAALALKGTVVRFLMSGHMHGGQINFPRYGSIIKCFNKFIGGMYEVGNMILYVSSGIGDNIMSIRFHSPTEIPVFVIYGAEKAESET